MKTVLQYFVLTFFFVNFFHVIKVSAQVFGGEFELRDEKRKIQPLWQSQRSNRLKLPLKRLKILDVVIHNSSKLHIFFKNTLQRYFDAKTEDLNLFAGPVTKYN